MKNVNEVYGYVKENIRLRVANKPSLFPALQKATGIGEYNKFCSKKDDICIEGYPSSANSFLYNVLKRVRDDISVSHHTHSIANIKRALSYDVPVVVVFRDPLESISSTVYRFEKTIYAQIIRYLNFYEYVVGESDSILLISFKQVTQKTSNTVRKIEKYSEISLPFQNMEKVEKNVKQYIKTWSKKNKSNRGGNLPSKNKDIEKNKIKEKINQMERSAEARELYHKLIEVSRRQ